MITVERGSAGPFAERYDFDVKSCSYKEGWAQIDTKQDAPYYGTWTHPDRRLIFSFCEGDTYLTRCDTDEDYIQAVRENATWNQERGYYLGIDAGRGDTSMHQRFVALGLDDLCH